MRSNVGLLFGGTLLDVRTMLKSRSRSCTVAFRSVHIQKHVLRIRIIECLELNQRRTTNYKWTYADQTETKTVYILVRMTWLDYT